MGECELRTQASSTQAKPPQNIRLVGRNASCKAKMWA